MGDANPRPSGINKKIVNTTTRGSLRPHKQAPARNAVTA